MAQSLCCRCVLLKSLLQRVSRQQPLWLPLVETQAQNGEFLTRWQACFAKSPRTQMGGHFLAPRMRPLSTTPPHLPETMTYLQNLDNGAQIFLIGTAHVSSSSADEVREVIRRVRPQSVMVELCAGRARQLMEGDSQHGFSFVKALASKLGGGGASWAQMFAGAGITGIYRMLRYAGLDPGAEFKAAILEAQALNARVVYGDQEVNTTMARISQHLNLQDLLRMFAAASGQSDLMQDLAKDQDRLSFTDQIEAMKTRANVRKLDAFMRQLNPGLLRALVDERDQVMVDCLAQLEGTVVGVVGLGHLDGMERLWAERKSKQNVKHA